MWAQVRAVLAGIIGGLMVLAFSYLVGTKDPLTLTIRTTIALSVVWVLAEILQARRVHRTLIGTIKSLDERAGKPRIVRTALLKQPTSPSPAATDFGQFLGTAVQQGIAISQTLQAMRPQVLNLIKAAERLYVDWNDEHDLGLPPPDGYEELNQQIVDFRDQLRVYKRTDQALNDALLEGPKRSSFKKVIDRLNELANKL